MTDEPEQIDTDEEIEEKYSDEPEYTVVLNNKEYELNEDVRRAVQERAESEYRQNHMFDCFWKRAQPDQYSDDVWEENIHEAGDPVLVIETSGPMVPWDRLDRLDVEMQEVGPESQFDGAGSDDSDKNDVDDGNGMKLVPQDDAPDGDVEHDIGRTHFGLTPQDFEEVPDPDGEDADKIPPKPISMGDEPCMIMWLPENPDVDHIWATGEAICSVHSRVEWNVQKYANQPREEKEDSHDHWENLLQYYDCEVLGELQPSQDVPSGQESDDSADEEVEALDGKYGGDNWAV